jgi:broad specificity phosphatase PhoE
MEQDDAFDAPLTELGLQQAADAAILPHYRAAAQAVELVVASPLSRALDTADIIFPPAVAMRSKGRVCLENIREING